MSEQDLAIGKLTEAVDTLKDSVEKLDVKVSELESMLDKGEGAAKTIRAGIWLVFGAGGLKVLEHIAEIWGG